MANNMGSGGGPAPNCGHCGARIELAPGAPATRCQYCGTPLHAAPPPAYAPPQGPPAGAPGPGPGGIPVSPFGGGPAAQQFQYRATAGAGFKPWIVAVVVAPVLLLVGISVVVGVVTARKRSVYRAASAYVSPTSTAYTTPRPTTPLAEKVLMDTWTEPPFVAQIDGDGVEDVVARFTGFDAGKARLFVGAFDGAGFTKLWRIGPVADLGAESSATRTAVVGRSVLVADSRATLHVYALTTGVEQKTFKLTDRADRIYPSPDGKEAWLKMTDTKDLLFDVAAGALKAGAPYPAWMPEKLRFPDSFDCDLTNRNPALKARCAPRRSVPPAAGFNPQYALLDGDDGVALGVKTPGTRSPMLEGFDPKAKKARWTSPVSGDALGVQEGAPRAADLVADRLVVGYTTTGNDGRVAAFDVKTGKKLWEAQVARAVPLFLTVSASRVYLPASSTVRIYDASKGTLLGTLGSP